MKQFLINLLLLCTYLQCGAQAISLMVDNQTPGWLSSKINYGDQQTVENLTVSGYINATDLAFIGSLMQKQNLHKSLDLSEAYIVGDTSNNDNEISFDNIFGLSALVDIDELSMPKSIKTPTPSLNELPFRCLSVKTLIYGSENCQTYSNALWGHVYSGGGGAKSAPRNLILREGVTSIADYACNTSARIETVQCPNTISYIGKGAFLNCENLCSINLPNSIETIGLEAFKGTSFLPDTLCLPSSLTQYSTTAFPVRNGQVVIIPETVTKIDNTYKTYNNTMNMWTTWDYINSSNNYTWIMKSMFPPTVIYDYKGFLKGSTIYIPHNSYASYSSKEPFSLAHLIEAKIVEFIDVSPKAISLNVGNSEKIHVTILPADAEDLSLSWATSDSSVATVSHNGTVTAINPGAVQIFAISNANSEVKDFCEVTVIQPVKGIHLNTNAITLEEEESIQLVASILPENASNKNVNWTSSDVSVAMVSPDGTVYAIKPGQATIMATTEDGGFVALSKVNVKAKTVLVSNIDLNVRSKTLAIGETIQLSALILPEHASTKIVDWTSTNPFIASVNEFGFVTAISEGKTQIIATTTDDSNLSAICEITVEKQFISISQIRITPSDTTLVVGQTMVLNAIIIPNDASNKAIVWSSTNPSIAIVSAAGEVKAIASGEAIIIASTQDGSNLSAMCQITVKTEPIYVESIDLNPSTIEGCVNETYHLEANVLPVTASNKDLKWTSSDENIATVENGEVKLESVGTAIITARAIDGSNIKSECTVIVSDEAGIDSIIADKDSFVKIYNLSGVLVYNGALSDIKLSSGFYIVICNGYSFKIRIE